jgi:LmbE family N-acetylglucosaminyl deacetylase
MAGEPTNHADGAFAATPIEDAAAKLAAVLHEENAEVLTIYDENGNYGHPDHIQVHRVGARASELAETPRVYEATMNRDYIQDLIRSNAELMEGIEDAPNPDEFEIGMPASAITTTVDVRDFTAQKRAAMEAHASQIPADSFFLQLPPDAFREAFGYEWFIRRGATPGTTEDWLF